MKKCLILEIAERAKTDITRMEINKTNKRYHKNQNKINKSLIKSKEGMREAVKLY